ncbi:MAG: acyl-CoA dehydrogenase family protein [Myxococcales bacterium]|nr:acyl-CoA dehydrogenase family protein [Myxococcales bacterium]
MRFAFDADTLLLRDAVRDVLDDACTPAAVRASWTDAAAARQVWDRLADAGVFGMLVDESCGGLGLGPVEQVLVLEELGRAAAPGPIVETAALAPGVFAAAPALGQRRAALAAGGVRVCRSGPLAPYAIDAPSCDVVLVESSAGLAVWESASVRWEAARSVDGARRLYRPVGEAGAPVAALGPDVLTWFNAAAAAASAAVLIGLSSRMLELAVEYAKIRTQFGQPIGSFQAVQHRLADAAIAIEFARPMVYRAAWTLANQPAAAAHASSIAKMFASDVAHTVGQAALQVHGAIGYSYEHDLHLYMKRAWALAATDGDAAWHRRRLSDALFAGDTFFSTTETPHG